MSLAALSAVLFAATQGPILDTARLADGLDIVVLRMPRAKSGSLRLVVRAGGAHDPVNRAGLAHLVEHLLLEGSYDEEGHAFADDARRAGARLNAHTTPDLTTYELDAPSAVFSSMAERLVKMITSPAWERAPIATERGVIETEAEYHASEGLLSLVDRAVFPAPTQAGPLAGTSDSRASLGIDDAARFFVDRYQPASTTIIFAGPMRMEEARALVERAYRIPPALPAEAPAHVEEPPNLPLEQRLQGGITVILLGHAIDPVDIPACDAIAALVELRLLLSLHVEGPMVPGVTVFCPFLRGTPFIAAAVYTTRLEAAELPEAVDGALASVAASPPTATERAAVNARLERRHRETLSDPAELAERMVSLVALRADQRSLAARIPPAPLPDAAALRRVAERSFTRERRFLVHITPMHN